MILTDCCVTNECFFVLEHGIDRQFLTILRRDNGNRRLLIRCNRWHLLDHLKQKRVVINSMKKIPFFALQFALISVSSWCVRVNELYSMDLMTPRDLSDNMICSTSSSAQPWFLCTKLKYYWKKKISRINWLKGLLGQVFGCHGIWICLFDEFEHFLGGQWHHIELWIFERNCNGMFKKQNRRVTQYYWKSSAPPGITAYLLLLFHIWIDEWRHERLILVHINSKGLKIKQQHAARSSLLVSILCSLVWLADCLLKRSENRTKWKKRWHSATTFFPFVSLCGIWCMQFITWSNAFNYIISIMPLCALRLWLDSTPHEHYENVKWIYLLCQPPPSSSP